MRTQRTGAWLQVMFLAMRKNIRRTLIATGLATMIKTLFLQSAHLGGRLLIRRLAGTEAGLGVDLGRPAGLLRQRAVDRRELALQPLHLCTTSHVEDREPEQGFQWAVIAARLRSSVQVAYIYDSW